LGDLEGAVDLVGGGGGGGGGFGGFGGGGFRRRRRRRKMVTSLKFSHVFGSYVLILSIAVHFFRSSQPCFSPPAHAHRIIILNGKNILTKVYHVQGCIEIYDLKDSSSLITILIAVRNASFLLLLSKFVTH
jgi:hypothetical protein